MYVLLYIENVKDKETDFLLLFEKKRISKRKKTIGKDFKSNTYIHIWIYNYNKSQELYVFPA